eukprot:6485731-Amphidinium_carterae.3
MTAMSYKVLQALKGLVLSSLSMAVNPVVTCLPAYDARPGKFKTLICDNTRTYPSQGLHCTKLSTCANAIEAKSHQGT